MPRGNPRNASDFSSKLKSLSLNPSATPAPPPDSWEEEALTPPSTPSSSSSSPRLAFTSKPEDEDISLRQAFTGKAGNEDKSLRQTFTGKPENEDTESIPSAPPPTPISPTHRTSIPASKANTTRNLDNVEWDNPWGAPTSPVSPRGLPNGGAGNGGSRPEKSTAVAGRMIAAGLGVKQPKKSEENKAYEKAVREKEKKRREKKRVEEKERADEAERAKKSVWEG